MIEGKWYLFEEFERPMMIFVSGGSVVVFSMESRVGTIYSGLGPPAPKVIATMKETTPEAENWQPKGIEMPKAYEGTYREKKAQEIADYMQVPLSVWE